MLVSFLFFNFLIFFSREIIESRYIKTDKVDDHFIILGFTTYGYRQSSLSYCWVFLNKILYLSNFLSSRDGPEWIWKWAIL